MSVKFGMFAFSSMILSNPDPIETTKKTWGIIPMNVAKKKLNIFTLKRVGKRQLSCQGTPPINR